MNARSAFPGTPAGAELLVLAPCLPRPDGDAVSLRWYHLLRFLARHFRVHLGCSADLLRDGAQFSRVRALCHETCFVAPPGIGRSMRLGGMRLGAMRLGAMRMDPALQSWATRLCARRPVGAVLACGARMGACLAALPPGLVRMVDFVELESDRQRRRGAVRPWPGAVLWRRQAQRLLAIERCAGAACDHALFAVPADVARFRLFAPESAHKAQLLASGVDPEHYSPHILQRSPYRPGERVLLLAGPLHGDAAADAARWLAAEVFAPLRAADPSLSLYLVDASAHARRHPSLGILARRAGVAVVGGQGAAFDLRPYLAHAALVLAPPTGGHAAGMAVLAAMAMQKPVLGLPRSLSGLACLRLPEALAAADAPGFRERIGAILAQPGASPGTGRGVRLDIGRGIGPDFGLGIGSNTGPEAAEASEVGRAARARVLREHDWNLRLAGLPALLAAACPSHAQPLASAG